MTTSFQDTTLTYLTAYVVMKQLEDVTISYNYLPEHFRSRLAAEQSSSMAPSAPLPRTPRMSRPPAEGTLAILPETMSPWNLSTQQVQYSPSALS